MKRILTLLAIATFASCSLFAQDDMYFTPKSKAVKDKEKSELRAAEEKKRAEAETAAKKLKAQQDSIELSAKKEWFRKNRHRISQTEDGKLVYHVGRDVSDDEYNRRGKFASTYTVVSDSTASDIIEFTAGDGNYPDSLAAYIDTISGTVNIKKKSTDRYDDDEDYYFSRLMNRFDGFYGSRRMWLLYNDPWYSHWAYDPFFWNDPWYWNRSWVYDPWYWNDPWYYGGYYGYYGRYYYGGYYGWTTYHPYIHHRYYYTPVALSGSGGTHHVRYGSHGRQAARDYRSVSSNIKTHDRQYGSSSRNGDFTGYRGNRSYSTSNNSNSVRGNRSYSTSNNSNSARSNSSYSNSSSRSSSPSRSYSSSSSSSSSSRSSSGGGGSRGGGGIGHGGRR